MADVFHVILVRTFRLLHITCFFVTTFFVIVSWREDRIFSGWEDKRIVILDNNRGKIIVVICRIELDRDTNRKQAHRLESSKIKGQ